VSEAEGELASQELELARQELQRMKMEKHGWMAGFRKMPPMQQRQLLAPVCLSLSLSRTHTHTHTLSLSLTEVEVNNIVFLSRQFCASLKLKAS
jgi:hypothetical protein